MNRPVHIFKDVVSGGGRRAMVCIGFHEPPPKYIENKLRSLLDSQGLEIQGNGKLFKFWCSTNHINDVKTNLVKMALHRTAYERHDDIFPSLEDAKECWGVDNPEHENYIA